MKVRLTTDITCFGSMWHAEDVIDVTDAYGQRLLSSGQAEPIQQPNSQPQIMAGKAPTKKRQ